jgi:putative heme iron utilization protein
LDADLAKRLRALVEQQEVGSLGTLHDGAPFVSMVPFALLPGGSGFLVHVSALAAHTRDMLADTRVSLMIMAARSADVPAQALARVTVQGDAMPIPQDAPVHALARAAYLARFPESAQTFELDDFALFAIRPRSLRYVGGFAQAKTITPEGFAEALGGSSQR